MKLKSLLGAALLALAAACNDGSDPIAPPPLPGPPAELPAGTDTVTTASGLRYADITVGTGATVAPGALVTIHYTGWLTNGTAFDAARFATFDLDELIAGWREGVPGMKVGGKRRLIIPPNLAYGAREIRDAQGRVLVPANSTLIFDIEVVNTRTVN